MHYLLLYDVVDDYVERRAPFRDDHLRRAWQAQERGELLLAGALAHPTDGTVLLFQGTSPEVAERFAKTDPYVTNWLVTRWRVREWTTVVGEGAATPVRPRGAPKEQPFLRGLGLGPIGQIAIPVRDLRRAVGFYRDTLGMRFLFEAPPALAFFDCAGVRLMLSPPETPELERHSSILYFRVTELHAAYEALKARGVVFDDAPHLVHKAPDHELWMCFFRDTEANIFALMSEIRER